MKNKIAILSLSALALALGPLSPSPAAAGDHEWASVGKVLTGVAVVHALSHAFPPPPSPVYISAPACAVPEVHVVPAAPVVVPAPIYVQPAPVVVVPRPVYAVPAPVCVAAAPVCVPRICPPPFVRVGVGVGVGLHLSHHPRPRWR